MTFEEIYKINVNEYVEKRDGLTYLTWSKAWAEFKKLYPGATYELLPWTYDDRLGYMVYTTVTADDLTYKMWLPVMDSHKKAMKAEPYEVKTKYSTYTVPAATMFDINTAYMRCLVKNLAMFGLGLYIYAGEDLPENTEIVNPAETTTSVAEADAFLVTNKICKTYNLSREKEERARGMTPGQLSKDEQIRLAVDLMQYAFSIECERLNRGEPRMREQYGLVNNNDFKTWRAALNKIVQIKEV